MLKRTLAITRPMHLSTRNGQLVLEDKAERTQTTRPIEDIGYLVLENPQITLTQVLLQVLSRHNTAVIFCDQQHLPSSMLLHLHTNSEQNLRFRSQLAATLPLQKRLWQQTVVAKVQNQALLLDALDRRDERLFLWANEVQSGDKTQVEAKAARAYWPQLMGIDFNRARGGVPPNNALNYGYAILRAATARALSGVGLLPTWGIHHKNKYNDFCLADDIMEPYRPFVDALVVQMQQEFEQMHTLTPDHKQYLLGLMQLDTYWPEEISPLEVSLRKTARGLWRCFEGTQRNLPYPTIV